MRAGWRRARGHGHVGWPLAGPIAALVAATVLAAARSERPLESLTSARTVLLLPALWVVIDALPTVRAATRALVGLLAVLGVVSVLGIVQVEWCGDPRFIAAGARLGEHWSELGRFFAKCHRAHGFYTIYMTLGGVLNIVLLAALPILLGSRARPRWVLVAWLLDLIAFALTYVRGAWLGFVAGALVLVASARRHRLVLVIGLAVAGLALLLVPGVRGRARTITDPRDPTASERVLMWASGVAMARDHPLTGVGPGQVKHVYPRYAAAEVVNKQRGHLHNTPLQILVERGVLGLLAWLWLFGAFLARAIKLMRLEAPEARALTTGGVAAIAGFLVAGFFEHNFGDTEVLLVALLVMAIVLVVERDARPG